MKITSKCLKFNYSTLLKKKKSQTVCNFNKYKKERSGERERENPRQLEKTQWKIEFLVRLTSFIRLKYVEER